MTHYEIIVNQHYKGVNPTQYGYEKCSSDQFFGPAVRTYWLLHFVVSGKGILKINGEEYTVNAGEVFVIPPFVESYYEADEDNPWNYTWIGFESEIEMPEILNSPVITCPGIGKKFEEMRGCQGLGGGKSAFLCGKIWELISALLEYGKNENDYVEQALSCMNSEYMSDLTVNKLAKRLNLDRCYFSSLFTKKVGISPSKYLMELRLEKAAELMVKYGECVSVAAASVGYSDIYNFSKMFKKKYGQSPRNYVKTFVK